MKLNRLPLVSSKQRFYLWILLAGVLAGSAVTLLAWLQKWTLLRAPHWLYAALFWAGVAAVIALGIFLKRRLAFLSRLWVMLSVVGAIGLVWLFPETLAPGCGGMPRAFAHWENQCTTTCTTVCTWWVPLSNPTCAAQPHMPWDIGCCWAYGDSCTTSCNNVWVDDPPTVSGSLSCATPGNNGWCRGGAALNLSGSDPQGYPLTISGSIGGAAFSCSGSCSQALPDGTGSASYTAVASGGGNLSSASGSASYQMDGAAPSLAISVPLPSGAGGWFTSGPVTATASASDAISGVTSVSINGSGVAFTASLDGIYNLTATAADNAGNVATTSAAIKIDSTPPSLSVSVSPADGSGGWYRSPAVLTAAASDLTSGLAGVQFNVDGGAWQDGSSASVSAEGTHTVQFQARDLAGNSTTTSPVTVQVDVTPPDTAASIPVPDGLNGWFVSPVTITSNSSDGVSGLASQNVSLDGSSWGPAVTISTDGVYTVQAQAQDNAGNSASSSQTVHVDMIAPDASLLLPPSDGDNGWYVSSVSVEAVGTDATSGVAGRLVSTDGTSWSASLTLAEDGVYTVQGRVTDNAGNITTVSRTIHIDHTQPVMTAPTVVGSSGLSGWYTTSVQFDTSASDVTSGLSSLLYSVDGGTWQAGPLTLADGRHEVQVQATDLAGNTSVETQTVNVDSAPPQSGFVSPAEGSVAFAHGSEFLMNGQSSDATSGLSEAQISLDGGTTWQPIALASDGSWSYTWDTTSVSNGPHTVLVEAGDLAGNQEHTARITVVIANIGPSVSMPDSFWVYQNVDVAFSAGILPITGARITISDGGDHHRTFNYSGGDLPSNFQWDGKWEDGTWARPGSYQVIASAWDMFSSTGSATATVRVPNAPTPTPSTTPTLTPSPTTTATSTVFPTREPPTPVAPVHQEVVTHQEPPPAVHSQPVLLWPVFGFVALLAALASASLSDPRPRALKRLAQTLDSIQDDQP